MSERKDILLAMLALAGKCGYSSTELQKLIFLADKNCPEIFSNQRYVFSPDTFGPVAEQIFDDVQELSHARLAAIIAKRTHRYYATSEGMKRGMEIFASLSFAERDYIKKISEYVRSLEFTQLSESLNHAYPEFVNEVLFQEGIR